MGPRIPLAVKVLKIEASEGEGLVPLVPQAQANLPVGSGVERGEHARLVKGVADRGYLDGVDLWALHQKGPGFVILAQAGMKVREAASIQAAQGRVQARSRTVRPGPGRFHPPETLPPQVVAVRGLNEYLQGGPPPEPGKRRSRKKNPRLNAGGVRMGDNRVLGEGGPVSLTNGEAGDAFAVFDPYEGRRLLEHGLFREGKGPWGLEHAPQKTEHAGIIHGVFPMAGMALATAYRLWSRQQEGADPESPQPGIALLAGEGTTAWRRRLLQENRDKGIVVEGDHDGSFHAPEFALLAGLRINPQGIPPELGVPVDILARYGLPP